MTNGFSEEVSVFSSKVMVASAPWAIVLDIVLKCHNG